MQLEAVAPEPVVEPAAKREAPRWLRVVFSFPVALSALLCVLMVLTVRGRFNDPDMWWHLKTGEIIWNTHHIPTVDTFSFTAAGHPWVLQEWISQVTIYAAYHFGGYSGMMLWLCVLGSLLLIAGYALCWLYSGNAKVAFLGAMVIWLFSTVGLAIRPHMIGYLLLILELLCVHLGRTRDRRWFYALPPLFALWINVHSSFFLGLVILGLCLGFSFCNFRMGLLVSERWRARERQTFAVASVLSVAALFLNPIGPKLIVYPLDVMFNQHVNLGMVTEWQPPDLDGTRGIGLLAVGCLMLLIPILRRKEIGFDELGLFCLGFVFAIRHDRMAFVFGILAAPILCRLLADTWESYEFQTDRILPNAVLVGVLIPGVVFAFPSATNIQQQIEKSNPVKALDFIRRSGLSGRMLNDYVSGGYLIWAAPERKVFIDGRADLYDPAGVMSEYGRWSLLETDIRNLLDRRRITYCLLAHDMPITRVLLLLPNWKAVYSDQFSIVFARVHKGA